jgi:hypothetical protein
MAVVIADASPLIALAKINQLELLHRLFSIVLITDAVTEECLRRPSTDAERIASALQTGWLQRVSTAEQQTEKNKTDILHFANQYDLGKVHFAEEVCSGKTAWRDRLIAQLLNELKPRDVIIVSELSRLGRSMLECMEILAFATRKEICIYSVKGNWQLNDTIQSKIMALAFLMAAEIERDLISQRTKEALGKVS